MPEPSVRHRSARVRPYVRRLIRPGEAPAAAAALPVLVQVLEGLRARPERPVQGTPLVRLVDAQQAPTREIPVVRARGVSWW